MSLLYNRKIVSWDDMLQGLRDRYKQFPSSRTLNNILISTCIAHDKKAFMKADSMIQGAIEPDIWPQGVEYQQCKKFVNNN